MSGKPSTSQAGRPRRTGPVERVHLKYAQLFDISSGVFSTYLFRGNGMFDPYAGTGGAQPNGFDEYMALFKHFYVVGSKCTVYVLPQTSSSGGMISVTLRSDANSGTSMTSIVDATATPKSKSILVSAGMYPNAGITLERQTHKVLGIPPRDDALLGTASADPSEQWDWHVHLGVLDGATAMDCHLLVVVDYDAELIGRKSLIQS
jgi:hypothetical protein